MPARAKIPEGPPPAAGVSLTSRDDPPRFEAAPADPARRAGRRRGALAQAARARRLHPPGERRPVDVPAARLARPPEGRAGDPRGTGRNRCAGDVRARADTRRALDQVRPLRDPRALQAPGPQRPRLRAPAHARGDVHVPRARAAELPPAAAVLVPLPDEGPRRAASPRRAAPRPRVRDEGLVLLRP